MAVRQSVCCIRRRSLSRTGLVGLLFLGRLDTGSFIDEETGFVSLVRIYADQVEVLR